MAHRLQESLAAVETMTRIALAVLAPASGVSTYLGVRNILDGSPTAVFFAAIIYSASVSVGKWRFIPSMWLALLLPDRRSSRERSRSLY
jgi:hypothetical protein